MAKSKPKGGRVTPARGAAGPPGATDRSSLPPRRRLGGPNRPIEGPVQAGRRPSSPLKLLAIAAAWIACGVYALVFLTAGWKLIPVIVFIGVGLLFLRGAAATVMRRSRSDS